MARWALGDGARGQEEDRGEDADTGCPHAKCKHPPPPPPPRSFPRPPLTPTRPQAISFRDWESAAQELDRLEGNDQWRLDDASGDYQPELIRARLKELDDARTNCDLDTMIYLIRTGLSRDLGGMGNIDLYRHSYVGTKHLIERYVSSAVETIESLVDKSAHSADLDPKDLLEEMLYARQSFGRSALLLSGGATFGMSHIGVLKTLYEAKLLPRIISGASAGSIVCSVLCTRKDDEIPALIEAFPHGDLGVFNGEGEGVAEHVRHLLTRGSWYNIDNLIRVMRNWLGDLTFQEAYNRTRRICNICVSSATTYELPRLLNYITAPNVIIWSAVAASCSVPFVFQGTPILIKDPATGAHLPWNPSPQRYIDGSVENDLPMMRLAELFNVNHFIVSQVNPHVVPFLPRDDLLHPAMTPGRPRQRKPSERRGSWMYTVTSLAKEEGLHRMQFLAELGFFPHLLTKLRCVLSQKYSGDITIIPEIPLEDAPLILKNPTPEFMMRNCLQGERATWPKLSRIRDRLAIELALDQAVHALRTRVVFSRSQVDLRRALGLSDPQSNWVVSMGEGGFPRAIFVQQPSPEDATPGPGDWPFGRRRGSGSSIQLMAARHKKPFEDESDDESDDDDRLELVFRPSARFVPHANRPGILKGSKSHSYMQGGKPVEAAPPGEFKLPSYEASSNPPADTTTYGEAGGTAGAEQAAQAAAAAAAARSPPDTEGDERASGSGPGVESFRASEEGGGHVESQTSDGDLQSDADPYQATSSRAGASRGEKEEPA